MTCIVDMKLKTKKLSILHLVLINEEVSWPSPLQQYKSPQKQQQQQQQQQQQTNKQKNM